MTPIARAWLCGVAVAAASPIALAEPATASTVAASPSADGGASGSATSDPPQVIGAPQGTGTPQMTLTFETEDPAAWVMRLVNHDSVPIRIIEDWRLVSLDVTPPPPAHGRAITQHCVLPVEMRPVTDAIRQLVVPPSRAYVTVMDPRAFCFGGAMERALVPGATVVAHFGFPPDRAWPNGPPLIAVSADPSSYRVGLKEIASEPFTIPEPPAPDGGVGGLPPPELAPLALTTATRVDVDNIRDLGLVITARNRTPKPITLLLSPHTVAIEATNHFGITFPCQWEIPPTAIPDLFTTIAPKGQASTQVMVGTICPAIFLAWPGLYSLRVSIDTRRVPAESVGIHAFLGKVTAEEPTLVRIRNKMRGMRPQ